MGRTNATYRDVLRRTEQDWSDFRRALRHVDREHFDRLIEHARTYADAAGNQNPTDPIPMILLSIVLAQERHQARLEKRVDDLEDTIQQLDTE